MRSGWLLSVAEGLCQQTLSLSFDTPRLMMIHWKIFKLQSGHTVYFGNFG